MSKLDRNIIQPIVQPTLDDPLVIPDYPYGFRLRTQIRYWVETRKGFGQRLVSQTLNPKTGKWNKPKAGTYSDVLMVYINKVNNHVETTGINRMYEKTEDLEEFAVVFAPVLTDYHRQQIRVCRAIIETRKHVKITLTESHFVSGTETAEQKTMRLIKEAEHRKEQEDIQKQLRGILNLNLRREQERDGIRQMTPAEREALKQVDASINQDSNK